MKASRFVILLIVVGLVYASRTEWGRSLFEKLESFSEKSEQAAQSEDGGRVEDGGRIEEVDSSKRPPESSAESEGADRGAERIAEAFANHDSDVVIESKGEIVRLLRDDNEGSRHQKFIVKLSNGHTVLFAHNIDLADRVPCERGDTIRFRGEYEWNEQGGVVHWTHHDPQRRRPGGWIEHAGQVYQ